MSEATHRERTSLWRHDESERDACAIIANVKKDGRPSHGNVKRTLEALARMGHRTGEVEGEGDGAGLQTDIPRERWAKRLEAAGLRGELASRAQFTVAHVCVPHERRAESDAIMLRVLAVFEDSRFEVLVSEPARVRPEALGPQGRAMEPVFWQVAALPQSARGVEDRDIFHITLQLERELPVHVASLSPNSVIYKVRGDADTLRRYFPELSHPDFKSAITLGHGRYSTNTDSRPERAQMFSTLGHNGEINSVDRLGREALALGFQLPSRASDSQVLDRVVESFMFEYRLSLMDALEIVFPPVWSEIESFPAEVRELYRYWRRAFGAHAQGPAAIIARQADEIVFSSDALGLRPLWCGETEKEFFASSEKGVVPLEQMVRDPRPLAPGEKMGFLLKRDVGVEVFEYHELQRRALEDARARFQPARLNRRVKWAADDTHAVAAAASREPREEIAQTEEGGALLDERLLAAFGWGRLEEAEVRDMAETGKEPISGLGWDGPLAALSQKRRNVSDYFHERVAVVTNPAIDREREADHFSTRVFLGARPLPARPPRVRQIELRTPLLFGGLGGEDEAAHAAAARATGQRTLAEVLALCDGAFGKIEESDAADEVENVADGTSETAADSHGALRAATLDTTFGEDETLELALARICEEAARLVRESRTSVLILDDARAHRGARLGIDAHLALAAVDARLRDEGDDERVSLRRRVSLVLRAGSLRNVHDVVFALGCGADAVNPYALFAVAARGAASDEGRVPALVNCASALLVGIEKVLSTMGIHELDGYGRLFASVGLAPDVEEFFGVANYCGSAFAGLSLCDLERDARARLAHARGESEEEKEKRRPAALPGEFREQPSLWNVAGRVARGEKSYEEFAARLREIEETRPVALRQLLEVRAAESPGPGSPRSGEVDTRAGKHSAPFYFSAMSFGSQGETSFRAYAEAARRLDIICVNGEGGEIPDMLGRYREHRGQQVASGRFGVNAQLLNSCDLLEIKIGQGAKPGEGGLLPGFKVTARIAETRHTPAGIDLHLAVEQSRHLLHRRPRAGRRGAEDRQPARLASRSRFLRCRFIGPIATGVAKARADIIAISRLRRRHGRGAQTLPAPHGATRRDRACARRTAPLCERGCAGTSSCGPTAA